MPAPNPFLRLMRRIEDADALDAVIHRAEPLAVRLVADRRLRRFFHGDGTGIPAHVIIKDVPFGAWFMAIFLDFFRDPGSERAPAASSHSASRRQHPRALAGGPNGPAPANAGGGSASSMLRPMAPRRWCSRRPGLRGRRAGSGAAPGWPGWAGRCSSPVVLWAGIWAADAAAEHRPLSKLALNTVSVEQAEC